MKVIQFGILSTVLFSFGTDAVTICDGPSDCTGQAIRDDVVICSGDEACLNADIEATDRVICSGEGSCISEPASGGALSIDAPYIVCSGVGSCRLRGTDQTARPQLEGNVRCSGGPVGLYGACSFAVIDGPALCDGFASCINVFIEDCAECSGQDSCSVTFGETINFEGDIICSGVNSCSRFSGALDFEVDGNAICSGQFSCNEVLPINATNSTTVVGMNIDGDLCCTCPFTANTTVQDCCVGADADGDTFIGCPFTLTCDVIVPSGSPTTATTPSPTQAGSDSDSSSDSGSDSDSDSDSDSNSDSDSDSDSDSSSGSDSGDSDNSTAAPTTSTTSSASPSPSPVSGNDDSDSDSDSDSDDDVFSAFSAMFGAKQDDINLNAPLDDGSAQQMKISLSDWTLMNLWLMIGLCLVGNALAFYLCRGKGKAQQSFVGGSSV